MSDDGMAQQRGVILAALQRLHPKCTTLRVFWHDDEGRWFVQDQESDVWWEALPGQAPRDAAGYHRPDTVRFDRIVWRKGAPREREDAGIPVEELGGSFIGEDEG